MRTFLIAFLMLFSYSAFGVSDRVSLSKQISFTATVTSSKALDSNSLRSYLLIQNIGASGSATISVKLGSAQTGSEGIQIPPGGSWEPNKSPIDSVWIESASGTQSVVIVEGISS